MSGNMTDALNTPVEQATLNELKDILEEEFPLLVHTYIEDAELRMARLRTAVDATDSTQVRAEAHALKGASRNVGANPLSEMFARMEAMGSSGEIAAAGDLLLDIEQELSRAQDFLRAQI